MQGVMVATLERKVECRVVRDEKIKYALEEANGLRNRLVHGYSSINAFVLQCKMRCILVHKSVFFYVIPKVHLCSGNDFLLDVRTYHIHI
ncbi:MAG: hypothetical protein FFODKBPE_00231 [Candidatus Argoarchaeum ethanivorans]|uniref:Uncharacterized protein n=1 Tax=Candidatus Argoarchaeum ethanivorans TaxID=2608793 RepID=A0A811TBF6_9EURY|nr:MAG: hypothetical protein FFODKBPE_00231 [Candidatus Argoarchaeum ethanivorans]